MSADAFAHLPRWAAALLLMLLFIVLPAVSLHLGDPDGFARADDLAQRAALLDEFEVLP